MEKFSTKQNGDIAEYRVIAELLRRGARVMIPCGDRLPYDIAIDDGGRLIRVQVKMAWWSEPTSAWVVDVRRSQTNRRIYKSTKYRPEDFEFLIAWLPIPDVFYIMPSVVACSYAGSIYMVEGVKRQRPPKSQIYREKWDIMFST